MNRPTVLPLAAVTLAAALTACGTPTSASPPTATVTVTQTATASPTETTPTPTESPAATASPAAPTSERNAAALVAIQTAEQTVGGTVIAIEWYSVRNRWEVEVLAGNTQHELYLSPDGTSVTKNESEPAESEDVNLAQQAQIAIADAINTVLAASPGDLEEADLTTRRGQVAWEVQVRGDSDRGRTYVDAVTGNIV